MTGEGVRVWSGFLSGQGLEGKGMRSISARRAISEGLSDLAYDRAADEAEALAAARALAAESEAYCPARPYSDSWWAHEYSREEAHRALRNANLPTEDTYHIGSYKEEDREILLSEYVDLYDDKYGFKPRGIRQGLTLAEVLAMLNDLAKTPW